LNGKASITPEIAIRLGKALGTSPESWLNQQMQYDLWQTEKTIGNIEVKPLSVA
jgi:addiction module HigA family antidote